MGLLYSIYRSLDKSAAAAGRRDEGEDGEYVRQDRADSERIIQSCRKPVRGRTSRAARRPEPSNRKPERADT